MTQLKNVSELCVDEASTLFIHLKAVFSVVYEQCETTVSWLWTLSCCVHNELGFIVLQAVKESANVLIRL